jgi:hypothetical protein
MLPTELIAPGASKEQALACFAAWQEREALRHPRFGASDRGPHCGSETVVPIIYGYPSNEGKEAARGGRIVLGGCYVEMGAPSLYCKACSHRWSDQAKILCCSRRRDEVEGERGAL